MTGNDNDCVNEITANMNNNVVNIVIDDLFVDQAVVDTGSYLSLVDKNFCKKHNLHVLPLTSGESRSYVAAGETRITAIGSTNLVLTFAGERFLHNFQIIDRLLTNILIGVDFISRYNCVAYLSQGVFFLGDARITVPLVVEGDTLGLAELGEQVTLQPNTQSMVGLNSPKINKQPVPLEEPILDRIGLVSIAQENALAAYIDLPCYLTGQEQRDYPIAWSHYKLLNGVRRKNCY